MKAKALARKLWTEWIRPLALPFLLITAAKSALADINPVPTGSMQPTILCGDVVFVNKLAYDLRVPFTTARLARWADPAHGDIVVCFAPDSGMRLVKRVVALPGDTIELRRDILVLNGRPQIWTALCAYLLVTIAKRENALLGSLHQVLQVISIAALEKIPLSELFAKFDTTNDAFDPGFQLEINGF